MTDGIWCRYGSLANPHGRRAVDACSDYQLCTPERCLVAHNDDNDFSLLNHTALITATFGAIRFTGFTYLGDLTTGAFGFNNQGVAVSLNWVGPTDVLKGGLGRGFIARSVLDAVSFQDAVTRVTVPNQCAGHNYQLMDYKHRSIVNIETAPGQLFSYKAIADPYFHANQYTTLQVPQYFTNSSVHRLARVQQLAVPYDAASVLKVLGDQHDVQYPIFHDQLSHDRGELSDWTLATALFDLDNRTMTMYHGNPSRQVVMYQLPLE